MTAPRKTGLFARTFAMFLLVPVVTVGLFTLFVIPRHRATMLHSMESEIHGTLAAIVGINQSTYIQEDFASIVDINALLLRENPDIQYLAPKSGALGWIDTFALPAKGRNDEGGRAPSI